MKANKPIYSLKLARQLIKDRHVLVDALPNFKFPGYSVFYFENSPELDKAIENYSNK